MTKEWFSAAELAGIPGMPKTKSGVIRKISREGWQSRTRKAAGGGREYHISSLPIETQAALLKQFSPSVVIDSDADQPRPCNAALSAPGNPSPGPVADSFIYDRENIWQNYERKTQKQKDKAQFKLQLLLQVMALHNNGMGLVDAFQAIGNANGTSWRTIQGWYHGTGGKPGVKHYEKVDWLAALVPGFVGRTKQADCSDDAWETFKADYLRPEKPTAAACYERLKRAATEQQWHIPSLRTLERRLKQIPVSIRVLTRDGEVALMALYPAQQRTVSELYAGQWINGDGYKHNVFCRWPNGDIARPKTWFWQDVYSRKIMAYRTDLTEHTDVIRVSFGDLVEKYGIPEHATIDNTRAAANKWMTGRVKNRYRFKIKEDDPMGLFPSLDVDVHWTSVHKGHGHGQAKPVERSFGVGGIGEVVDKHPALAGAYTGNNTNAKPENYGSKAIPIADFLNLLVEEIKAWNAKEERRTEMCDGKLSFDQAFANSYENAPIRKATDEQRRLWLLSAEAITVKKDGTFTLDAGNAVGNGRNRYSAPELLEYHGHKIVVRFDPQQLHGTVYAYTLDGRYIAPAECIDATGFGDTEAARAFNKTRKQFLKATKLAAKAEITMSEMEVAKQLPAVPDENVMESKIVRPMMPDPVRGRPAPQPTLSAEDRAAIEAFQADFEQPVQPIDLMNDPTKRYEFFARIGLRIEAKTDDVTTEEHERYHLYIKSDEYTSMKAYYEEFGLDIQA